MDGGQVHIFLLINNFLQDLKSTFSSRSSDSFQDEKGEFRICYEDEQENDNELIYPCACDGTQKYVHEECLAKWRKIKSTEITFLLF